MNNDIRNLSKWLNEEQLCDIDLQALARVLAFAQQADHSEQHLDMVKAQPAQQEPTGMLHIDRLDKWLDASLKERKAQRTWVGLTDEESDLIVAMSCKKDSSHLDAARVARVIEAKLKDKNI